VYSVLYNLRIIFTTILGVVFLDENLLPLQVIGGLLIFASVVAVKQKGRRELTTLGIRWGLSASIVISFLNLNEKELIKQVGYMGYMIPVMVLAAVIMWAVLLVRGGKIKPGIFTEPRTLSLMLLRALSAFGFTLAFNAGGLLSVSTYLSSLGVVIIVILGALLLNERDYLKRKIAAAVMAFIGLTLIFVSKLL
jgi:drug/metabolite transporter (DMT)-like permease